MAAQRGGYEVIFAVDGRQAISPVQLESPELILMDVGLPVMDGHEATRALKSADDTKRIPIIALTAHAMAGDREKSLEAGCDEYDMKPVDFPRLLGKIEALLPV